MNVNQGKNRIKIRRNSNKSSSTQYSNENRSIRRKNSLAQSSENEQQIENSDLPNRNEEDHFSIKSGRITSMDKIKVTRINSALIHQENDRRNKPTISFVPRKSYARIERLHGEEILPLNNDQLSKTTRSQKYQRNRR